MFVLPSRNLSAALVLLALCACASSPYNAVPPGNAAASGSAPWELRAPIPAFTKKSSYLYVANSFAGKSETGEVDLYAFPLRTKPSPVGAIKTGTYYPLGLAVDLSGNLYVANNGASSVTVYPPGGSSPSKTITDGISAPRGIALDTDGTLYVANYSLSDYLGTVSVYPPGKTSPSYIINYGGCPFGLAVYKHNLYISDACDSQIFAVKKGSKTPKSLQLSNISFPLGIGFDSLGNLYVANASSDLIDVYPSGQQTPSREFSNSSGGCNVYSIALDKHDDLFVGYVSGGLTGCFVKMYGPGASTPKKTIKEGVGEPDGLAAEEG